MSFEAAFAMSDQAAFAEMGITIEIHGQEVRAIEQPGELASRLAEGGLAMEPTKRFEIARADVARCAVRTGSRVRLGTEQWRVAALRDRGSTVELVCMGTSGQGGRVEF